MTCFLLACALRPTAGSRGRKITAKAESTSPVCPDACNWPLETGYSRNCYQQPRSLRATRFLRTLERTFHCRPPPARASCFSPPSQPRLRQHPCIGEYSRFLNALSRFSWTASFSRARFFCFQSAASLLWVAFPHGRSRRRCSSLRRQSSLLRISCCFPTFSAEPLPDADSQSWHRNPRRMSRCNDFGNHRFGYESFRTFLPQPPQQPK